ncbi:hypothetical protein BS50DRAFT_81703 [Corynespora cassiicola Philippines]|uniref:C2H2-type domain-containing protein n=1 Tax=Corynespora cassiicola Philippines TaxID=1448308 RepID=A0A2T2NH85_CORCC|nr:hypothetical protein BS50DRAFT_81703 [Corynespora cassiicola Philippines]
MLSTNSPSSINRRRTQHRRQNSTPAAFEAPQIRPMPTTNTPQRRHQRSGMSLDLRGLNLEASTSPGQLFQDQMNHHGPTAFRHPFQRDDAVSITNLGQPSQHNMQVAQPHSQAQPGPQDSRMRSPVQQCFSSPRTPRRIVRGQSPQQPPHSPSKPPTEQQLKELHDHIQSVYGNCGQVFINILPTPTATPSKPAHLPSHEPLDAAPMPANFQEMADINLEPTSTAMRFDFDHPDADLGYESSSYYTSDAISPSPTSSPYQKAAHPFLEGIEEHPGQDMMFSQASAQMQSITNEPGQFHGLPMSQEPIGADLDMDASLEYTGISPEEVQRYISEQDATTNKWTCLYPDCGKIFGRRENIRSHVQTHLGDRQYKCNGCGKCFVRQHDLKRHAKIHTGNKPYKCPCGAGFARQDALTRHRQRGMCVGGFPDAVRRQAKRGRPKKNRPEMEQRVEKANKARRTLVSASSSVPAGTPPSEDQSPPTRSQYEMSQSQDLPRLIPQSGSFGDPMSSSSDPFSFDTASSPFADDANPTTSNFVPPGPYAGDVQVASINLLQQISQSGHTHTPPMSPADVRPPSAGSNEARMSSQPSPLKGSSTPSRSSIQSNPFSTPPTSPAEPKEDDLENLFNSMADSDNDPSCSQFDLEMKAMGDFGSLESAYDFLDFTV